jgi:homoserine dehydrogenase
MSKIEVLKFGSSVLHAPGELHLAVDEIYRRWRSGCRVLAVVSAFEGVTDQLIREAADIFGTDCPEATAAYVATGEQKTAALLVGSLVRSGIPARLVEPREIDLVAAGSALDSAPRRVDAWALERFWRTAPILVLPGFFGIDHQGHTTLFGRGGTDMSALFLASELKGSCRLLKDVNGVFDADPAAGAAAHRFTALSWTTAIEVSGPLIQSKALHYAQNRTLPFHVGRPNENAGTHVGKAQDEWATPSPAPPPLRVALLGCGVVGRGVYESLKRYPARFEIRHVLVRDLAKYPDIPEATSNWSVLMQDSIDLVIECIGGVETAFPSIATALAAKKFVVTANTALLAAHWPVLSY